jgi:hypothetical protein
MMTTMTMEHSAATCRRVVMVRGRMKEPPLLPLWYRLRSPSHVMLPVSLTTGTGIQSVATCLML